MIVAALLVLALASQKPTITFESPGIMVKAFCAELSRQTGRSYEVRDEIQSDLLAIRVTNLPLDELLTRLTFVERAKLEFDGAKYWLRPDRTVRAKLEADRLALRLKSIRETQAWMRQFVRAGPLTAEESKAIAQKMSALNAQEQAAREADDQRASSRARLHWENETLRTGMGQAMARMFVAIPAEELVGLGPRGTGVWSTRPMPLEHPTLLDGAALLEGLADDDRISRDTAAKSASKSSAFRNNTAPPPAAGDENIALLQLVVYSFEPHLDLTMQGFAANGKEVSHVISSVSSQAYRDRGAKAESSVEPRQELVPISAATAKMIKAWTAFPSDKECATWRGDVGFLEAYYNPEAHDPVAGSFGQAMLALAKARSRQLLVSAADAFVFILPTSIVVKGKLDVGAVEGHLADPYDPENSTAEYSTDDRWITVRPQDLQVCAKDAFDRDSLGTLLRAARDHHALSVMDVARYAAENDQGWGPRCLRAARSLAGLVPNITGTDLLSGEQWSELSFLGRLDDVQIGVGMRPEGLNLANCSEPQLHALWSAIIYGVSYHGSRDVWQSGRTDGLPHGLPGGGVLHLSETTGQALLAGIGEPGQRIQPRFYTPDQLARRLTKSPGDEQDTYNLVSVQPQIDTTYILRFDFPDETTATFQLHSYAPASAAVYSIPELPEAFRGPVQAAIQKLGS